MTETPAAKESVIGPRVGAAIIDIIIVAVLFFLMSALFGDSSSDTSNGASFSANLSGLPFVFFSIIVYAYYTATEFYLGATLGKKIVGLKVVADSGELTLGAAALRNVLRIVDGLPFFYLVGFICAVSRPDHKRVGDIVAKTSVVRA
ncbi:MAG: RDD family protein [Dehalococcoidia bacterium]